MLLQKSFLSFLLNILGSALGFISVFFVSRFMGPEAMGALSSCMAFAGLFAIFGDFGFGIAHFKRVSEGRDLGDCVATFTRIRLFTTLIMAAATLLGFYGSWYFTSKYPVDPKYHSMFYIVFIAGLLTNMLYVITYTFTAKIEKAKEGASTISHKLVTALMKVIVAVAGMSIIYLAWSNFVGVAVGILVSVYLFRKYPFGKFDKALYKSYLVYALPSIMIGVTETISMNIDKVFISYFAGTEKVGYYSSAQSIIILVSYVGVIFVSLLLPTYSAFHAQGNMEAIRNLANRVERYISILIMPVVFFVFFFADPIREIVLGHRFAASTPIISILALNAMLVIFNQPYSSQLLGTNQIKLGMTLGLIMLGINISCNLILIPESLLGIPLAGLGPKGAAVSLLVSSFTGAVMFRYYAFKTSESRPNYNVLIHLLIAVLAFGSLYLLQEQIRLSNYFLPVYIIGGTLIYLALMISFRQFTRTDFNYYMNMISPRLMRNYIRDELKD